MSTEIELKYVPTGEFSRDFLFSLPEIAPFCGEVSKFEMKTEYLDTEDGLAQSSGIGLRRRVENGKSFMYAKCNVARSGEFSIRGEWRVESDDLARAAKLLAESGAPTSSLVGLPLCTVASVSFTRFEAKVSLPSGLSFMLSFDEGVFCDKVPFSEIELELIEGEEDELLRFGRDLAVKYSLSPEYKSKNARARLFSKI